MIRPLDAVLAALVVGGAVWTYTIKHEAEAAADRVSELRRKIAAERETIMFLKADWAFLNAPGRLERLVERHAEELKLKPLTAFQLVRLHELPPPLQPEEDEVTTGSIVPTERPADVPPTVPSVPGSIDDILRRSR